MAYSFVDWETKTPGTEVRLREGYFSLPAFSLSGQTWEGYTELVRQYNYNASSKFVIVDPPSRPSSPTFLLCVRWRSGETVTRYKLWDDLGQALGLVGAPIYEGQVIPKNFVLEIWTIKDETAPTLASALTITTTIRKLWTDARDLSAYEDDSDPSVVTDYSVQMPARGTGQAALYVASENALGALGATWADASGNGVDLTSINSPQVKQGSDGLIFKDQVYVHLDEAADYLTTLSSQTFVSGFVVFSVDSWGNNVRLIMPASGIDVKLMISGTNKIEINGTDIGAPALQDGVNYLLEFHAAYNGVNYTISGGLYGDQEVAFSFTSGITPGDVQLNVTELGSGSTVKFAEMAFFTSVPSEAVKDAERDYLINKYIGWLVEGEFSSDVAGEDNP